MYIAHHTNDKRRKQIVPWTRRCRTVALYFVAVVCTLFAPTEVCFVIVDKRDQQKLFFFKDNPTNLFLADAQSHFFLQFVVRGHMSIGRDDYITEEYVVLLCFILFFLASDNE